MRIRTIKPEFFIHADLHGAEVEFKLPLRLAFIGLWCAADREGRFKWEPKRLGVQILPYDQIDFSRVLDALATRGFIRKYCVDDKIFGVIPSFASHQVINNREKESVIPECPALLDSDACVTRAARVPDAPLTCTRGREGNMEGNMEQGTGNKKASQARPQSREEFDDFFKEIGLYPRDAEAMWNRWEGNGWKSGRSRISDWKSAVLYFKSEEWMPSQKTNKIEMDWPKPKTRNEQDEDEDLMAKLLAIKAKDAREAAGDHPDFDPEWKPEELEEGACF